MATYAVDARIGPERSLPPRQAGVTLRAKGLIAVASLFVYLAVATFVVEQQRAALGGTVEEIERAHADEERLARADVPVAQAIIEVRERRKALSGLYRSRYDQVSMTWIGLGVVGMAVFGALLLLFLTRLGWDLRRLQERALALVKGYRGPALAVTRADEIGALERSVNRMQQELVEHEAQVEIARRQDFHREKMAAVGALAAQIAHEINNPIAVITGLAESLPDVKGSQLIVEQARRVAAITRQIAEFSSPQPAEPQLIDLNGVIESTCAFARYDARLRKLQLDLALDRQLPAVHAVGDHLTQVLMNLLMNAADAISEAGVPGPEARAPGLIRVATEARAGAVLMRVSDNGTGMDAGVRARAFEEFFTTKPKGKGCGIGLALSRRLLREAGADIDLESQRGRGTVVTVRLPLAA